MYGGGCMNILHLKYAIEIEKTQSISKAADNLFMGQPNLSRAIKELEQSIGLTIFKRSTKGMIPTPKGQEFLNYAKNIINQIDEIELKYSPASKVRSVFNISVPRASYISHAFTNFVAKTSLTNPIEFNYKETNSVRTINNILQADYNLGIIRYQNAFESYFLKTLNERGLVAKELWEFEYMVLMSKEHPLAQKEKITHSDLREYLEIAHGDPYVPTLSLSDVIKAEMSDNNDKKIFVYERGSQFDLLSNVHSTYMWVSPIPQYLLTRHNLVQRICIDNSKTYKDVLIYKKDYNLSLLDNSFIKELKKVKQELTATND